MKCAESGEKNSRDDADDAHRIYPRLHTHTCRATDRWNDRQRGQYVEQTQLQMTCEASRDQGCEQP